MDAWIYIASMTEQGCEFIKFALTSNSVLLTMILYCISSHTGSNSSNSYYLSGIDYVPGVYIYMILRVSQPPWKIVAGVF